MDWNMCLPRSFFWIWNLGGTHQLKRNPGLYFSPGNMHIITCTLHPPIVWDEIWWYTCPSCRNRGGKLQVGTTQQIESISFGLKTFFFAFEFVWMKIIDLVYVFFLEPVRTRSPPVRTRSGLQKGNIFGRSNPYPYPLKPVPVQYAFKTRSKPIQ